MEFWHVVRSFMDLILPSFIGIKSQNNTDDPMPISGPSPISFSSYSMPMSSYFCIVSMIQRSHVHHQIIIYKEAHQPTISPPNAQLSCTETAGTSDRGTVNIFVYDYVDRSLVHQILDHRHHMIKYKKNKMECEIEYIYKCNIFVGISQKTSVFCIGS